MSRHPRWAIATGIIILGSLLLLASKSAPEYTGLYGGGGHNQQGSNNEIAIPPVGGNGDTSYNPPSPSGGKSRLARVLESNERRYQHAIEARKKLISSKGGDGIAAFPPQHGAFYTLWDFFIPAFSCPFPVWRVGIMGDGGKWVCGVERVINQKKCVIYSMGVESQSSFEAEILRTSDSCIVYGFDFSVTQWGPELRNDPILSPRAKFHPYKIGGVDRHDASPKEYTLKGIMEENNHEFINILKVDIEGSEFEALIAVIDSFKGEPLPFGQLQLEIHFNWAGMHTFKQFLTWWEKLEAAGLRPFWTEVNLPAVNFFRGAPDVAEWSFINIRGKHALIDDSLPDYP